MDFVDYCILIYQKFINSSINTNEYDPSSVFESFFNSISTEVSAEELRKKYREGVFNTINSRLFKFKDELQLLNSLKEMKYYENSISIYSCFIIFWILENNLNLKKNEIEKLSEAIYSGTIGYRLLDLHQDHKFFGEEVIILGYRFINLFEELLVQIFPGTDSFEVIKRNADKYCEVEYIEKSNRWKQCPFNWEEVEVLGNKAAPIFSVFELIFKRKNISEKQVNEIMCGLKGLITCTQLNDDLMDSKEDLLNGFETLTMKGYYAKYGKEKINEENITAHLDQRTLKKFYNTQVSLFNAARNIFTKYNEDLLLLLMELQYYQFNKNVIIE